MPSNPVAESAKPLKVMQEEHRNRIAAALRINRLIEHANGDLDAMTASQIKAAEILLKKILPDLKQVEHNGEVNGQMVIYLDAIDRNI